MRIIPLILKLQEMRQLKTHSQFAEFEYIHKVSGITHRHIRSSLACYYYVQFALSIIDLGNKASLLEAHARTNKQFLELYTCGNFVEQNPEAMYEQKHFHRLLNKEEDFSKLSEDKIYSSGYVIDTLEASVWCLLTTVSFKEAVLKAVNLGEDTDTTGAVTGGLAALLYGLNTIPREWIISLARIDDIVVLLNRVSKKYNFDKIVL
jgi:ADP-ribosylglycohydrolase